MATHPQQLARVSQRVCRVVIGEEALGHALGRGAQVHLSVNSTTAKGEDEKFARDRECAKRVF